MFSDVHEMLSHYYRESSQLTPLTWCFSTTAVTGKTLLDVAVTAGIFSAPLRESPPCRRRSFLQPSALYSLLAHGVGWRRSHFREAVRARSSRRRKSRRHSERALKQESRSSNRTRESAAGLRRADRRSTARS